MKIAPSGSKLQSKTEVRLVPDGVDPSHAANTASAETNETKKQKRSQPSIRQASSNTRSRPCDAKQSELVSSRIEPLTPGAFRVANTSPEDTNETRKQRRSNTSVSQTSANNNTSRPSDAKQLEPPSRGIEPLTSGVVPVSHAQAISEIDAFCRPSLVAAVVDEDAEEQLRNRVTELEHRLRKQSELPSAHLNDELCYDAVGFVGRKEETELLLSRLNRIKSPSEASISPKSKELVLISGYSGVGKSQLTNTLAEQIHGDGGDDVLENGGMFARGKYDLNQRDQPCFGIAQALNELFDRMSSDQHGMDIIGQSIVSELGSEVQLLRQLIPNLHAVLPSNMEQQVIADDISSAGYEAGQEKWKYIFRSMIRILSSHCSPMVLVLDDLQWADSLSLNVMEYILTDTQNSNGFMIVGCFRSNEVDESHPLSKQIRNLQQKSETSDFHFTQVEVTNLQKDATNQVIMALLTIPNPEETKELTDICHNRTLGNPFFLIEFVTMLKRDDLIRFNMDSLKWDWDIQAIQEATVSTDNVVDLLRRRMVQLSDESQLLLQYAACLGASFGTAMMDIVWAEHSSTTVVGDTSRLVSSIYEAMVQEHFIESRGAKIFAWVHDKVQEAALSLGDAATRSFQFEIGTILAKNLTGQELDESIFNIVDLLNKGNEEPQAAFAELNLRAARRAKNLSAFDSAADYVSHGIGMLPEDSWESHRELILSLYCLGVEAELAAGRFSEMDKHSEAVLSRKDCTVLEKLPVIYAQSYRKCKLLVSQEAIDYTLKALKDLGCNIVPVSAFLPIYAIRSFRRAVRKGRTATRDFYKDLPILVDKKEKTIMNMLVNLGYAAYLSQNDLLFGLCTSKLVERTLKYGVSEGSCVAFAGFAVTIQAITGNIDDSIYFAEMGLLLQDRAGTKFSRAQCLQLACAFSLSYARPLESLLPSFLDGYQTGMQSGSISFGLWDLWYYRISAPFQLGTPLASIESELNKTIELMEEMGEVIHSLAARLHGQAILDLVGIDNKNQILRGDLFNCEGWVPPSVMLKNNFYFMRLQLSIIFADYDGALEAAVLIGDTFRKTHLGQFLCQEETFFRGLALYRAARQTRSAKHMKAGNKLLKRLDDWAKNGNPNVSHYIHLLNAEQASLNKKHNVAESFYRNSIDDAVIHSNWKHAALSCECYAHFLRDVTHKEDEFINQLKEASKYYREWGANAKARMLEDKLRRYL